MLRIILFSFISCAFSFRLGSRVDYAQYLNQSKTNHFVPYERGFVGYYGDAKNYQRERINEGSPFTAAHPKLWDSVNQAQICPGMVGPVGVREYYCHGREYGYCDRRSGTCFCNPGYAGIDCLQCSPSHYSKGKLCYPKRLCLNDCSKAGTCNYETGKCDCQSHRTGESCEQLVCQTLDENCLSCTKTSCTACIEGYFVQTDNTCASCAVYDPRCRTCDASKCFECSDVLLFSVRRSGARKTDRMLPDDELHREFSITLPFGTQDERAFDEAENFVMVPQEDVPLLESAKICHQGQSESTAWTCAPYTVSHKICGHYGTVSFSSPTYLIQEESSFVRLTLKRSGGGYSRVSVKYKIHHISTDDSDVSPTMHYTNTQEIIFESGVVVVSFLVAIHEDQLLEGVETFRVELHDPRFGLVVGPQYYCIVSIVDNDEGTTDAKKTTIATATIDLPINDVNNVAKVDKAESITIQTYNSAGNPMPASSDNFVLEIQPDFAYGNQDLAGKQTPALQRLDYQGTTNGQYTVRWTPTASGYFTISTFQRISGGLYGEYYGNTNLHGSPERNRIDEFINFNWENGQVTPHIATFSSIRWTGDVLADATRTKIFEFQVDSFVRIWFQELLVIDSWNDIVSVAKFSYDVILGAFYSIRIEYMHKIGHASAKLLWKNVNDVTASVIPKSNLFWRNKMAAGPIRSVEVRADDVHAFGSHVIGMGASGAIVGTKAHFSIVAYNYGGDQLTHSSNTVADARLQLIGNDGGGFGSIRTPAGAIWNSDSQIFDCEYTVFRSGLYRLYVTLNDENVFGAPFDVLISPERAIGEKSLVQISSNTITAGDTVSYTIQPKDQFGNDVTTNSVSFHVQTMHATNDATSVGEVQYIAGGGYRADARPVAKGINYIHILLNDTIRVANSPFGVTVLPSIADGQHCRISIPEIAYTSLAATVGIELYDQFKNRIVTAQSNSVLELVHLDTLISVAGVCVDLGTGDHSCQFVPTMLGRHKINVNVNGNPTENSGLELNVVAGPTLGQQSVVYGAGLIGGSSGIESIFYITLKDSYGNDKVYGAGSENVVITLDNGLEVISGLASYAGNGEFKVTYTPTSVGSYNIFISIDGTTPLSGPFVAQIIPGQFCPSCSNVKCTPGSECDQVPGDQSLYSHFVAGMEMPTFIQAMDTELNPIARGGNIFLVNAIGPNTNITLQTNDHGDGTYTIHWKPTLAGKYELQVYGLKPSNLDVTYFGQPALLGKAVAIMEELGQFSRDFRYISPHDLGFEDAFSVAYDGYIVPEFSEIYEFRIRSNVVDRVEGITEARVYIEHKLIIDTDASAWVIPPLEQILRGNTADYALFRNVPVKIRVELTHTYGPFSFALEWRSVSLPAEVIPVHRLFQRVPLNNQLSTVHIIPAARHYKSYSTQQLRSSNWTSCTNNTFRVESRDRYNNLYGHGGEHVHLSLSKDHALESIVRGNVTELPNGIYEISIAPHVAGKHMLKVAVSPEPIFHIGAFDFHRRLSPYYIHDSPSIITIHSRLADAATTFVEHNLIVTATGIRNSFSMTLRDTCLNDITTPWSILPMVILVADSGFNYSTQVTLNTNDNLTYIVHHIPQIAGTYTIQVSLNASSTGYTNTSHRLQVSPGIAHYEHSSIDWSSYSSSISIGAPTYFTLVLRDAFNNHIHFGGDALHLKLHGPEQRILPMTDLKNGEYLVEYTVHKVGRYQIEMILLNNTVHGLYGHFYTQALPRGISSFKKVTPIPPNIHLDIEIQSARYTGYITSPYTEEYTFSFHEHIVLYIDHKLVSNKMNLSAQVYYEIVVDHIRKDNNLQIFWQSVRTNKQIIPNDYLYPNGRQISPRATFLAH